MNSRKTILDELQEVSPLVATISGVTPYKVPVGYFEGLATQALQLIQDKNSTVLAPLKNSPYSVPQGYFESLAGILLQHIQQGDVTSSILTTEAGNNPYTVPAGYFDTLPAVILGRIKTEKATNAAEELEVLSPLLSKIGKKPPFSTPEGYFNELPDNASAGAQAIEFVNEELENLSPMMRSLQQQQAYKVPAGYFEALPQQLLQATQQQTAKVVSFSFTKRILRYAAAAVVAGLIITAGWLYTSNTSIPPDSNKLAAIEKIKQVVTDSLHNFDDQDLQSFLENQEGALTENTAIASNDLQPTDVQDMLGDVSDEELQQYLDQYTALKTTKAKTYTN
ncbi:MAG: hypothetical protein QM731_17450 [Chitinophagaceae bacterium]